MRRFGVRAEIWGWYPSAEDLGLRDEAWGSFEDLLVEGGLRVLPELVLALRDHLRYLFLRANCHYLLRSKGGSKYYQVLSKGAPPEDPAAGLCIVLLL